MDQPCGKRFVSMLPEWLPHWTNSNKVAPPGQLERILGVSSSTLDRVLAPFRISEAKRKKTSSLTALKSNIPLVDTQRRICTAGYFYADTVAHCGTTTKGDFAWTLTLTDDYTQWVCNQAVWNKGQYGVCQAFDKLLREIPFKIKGINTYNGGEFINYHLQGYFKNRDKKCEITRSRPMHKNDNARAEEKNRHKIRDLIGYDRLDDERFVNILNEIYKSSNLLNNHFSACMKIISKERMGIKIIKRYDKARTPYARFMEEAKKSGNKTKLLKLHQSLNPFELQEKIEDGLKKLIELKIKCEEEERGLLAPLTPSAAFDAAPGSNN